jgi:hypothetical protein
MFLDQASHLLRHVRSEWTRISWLLEYKTFVSARGKTPAWWREVRNLATERADATLAVAVATRLATDAFGQDIPRELAEWSAESLPGPVQLWIERYGKEVFLSDYPGTKLYLLLERELATDREGFGVIRRRLFPLHSPTRVAYGAARGIGETLVAVVSQFRYFLFRLRFHLAQSTRYLLEVQRWKRIVGNSSA